MQNVIGALLSQSALVFCLQIEV